MIMTPIKAFSGGEEALQRPLLSHGGKSAAPGSHLSGSGGGGEAESGSSVIAEGDLPGQFTRVMGKGECGDWRTEWTQRWAEFNFSDLMWHLPVCTQLLVSRSDEENISFYLQLIDKCLIHEVRAHKESTLQAVKGSYLFNSTFLSLCFISYLYIWTLIVHSLNLNTPAAAKSSLD